MTAAAERLSVGQSTMSATLARLRKLLNDPVMTRQGSQMAVTPVAEALTEPVREILDKIQTVVSVRAGFDPATDRRTFTIMASHIAAAVALRPVISHIATVAPHVQVVVRPVTAAYEEDLSRNQVDLLIIPEQSFPGGGGHPHERLIRSEFVVCVDAMNDDVGDMITLEQFTTMPYLATQFGSAPSLADVQLKIQGIVPRVAVTASFGLAPYLLHGTKLITLTAEQFGQQNADNFGLRLLKPPFHLEPLVEMMVWKQRTEGDPAHEWLRQTVRSFTASLR